MIILMIEVRNYVLSDNRKALEKQVLSEDLRVSHRLKNKVVFFIFAPFVNEKRYFYEFYVVFLDFRFCYFF